MIADATERKCPVTVPHANPYCLSVDSPKMRARDPDGQVLWFGAAPQGEAQDSAEARSR